ncbi:TetR family transcriptional regulator [Loigolactobacillus bifermentans]|nr:TetR family transcriptional regulator [Loigolactobacillus bifermentans]
MPYSIAIDLSLVNRYNQVMKTKNEAVRLQIIEAATELIIEVGIAGTSTTKVAQRMGGAQSNIYSYFKSKEALILGVFAYHQKRLTNVLLPVLNLDLAPRQQLRAMIKAVLLFADDQPTSLQIIAAFRAQPNLRHSLPSIAESAVFTRLFKLFAQYQTAGILKVIPAEFLAEAAFSLIVDYGTAKLSGEAYLDQLDENAIVTLVEALVLAPDQLA